MTRFQLQRLHYVSYWAVFFNVLDIYCKRKFVLYFMKPFETVNVYCMHV